MFIFKEPKLYDAGGDISKRWFVYYYIKNKDGKFVRKRSFISGKIKSKIERYKEADILISTLTRKLRAGWNPETIESKRNVLLIDAIDKVLSIKSNTLRKRSIYTIRNHYKVFKEFLVNNKLNNIKVERFDFYFAREMMDYVIIKRGVNNRTHNNYLISYKSLFNEFIKREYIESNPFTKIDKLPEEQATIVAYTKDELEIIKNELPGYDKWLYLASQLIFYCFIRPQELVRLKILNFNFERKEIIMTGNLTKNKRQETIVIPDAMMEILSQYNLERYSPKTRLFSKNLKPGMIEIAPTRIAEAWRIFADKAGLPNWKKMYDLKHTGAGMCVDAGINIRDLQLHLRHKSLEHTQIYLEKFRNVASGKLRKNFPTM